MASPQLDEGYTRLANSIIEAIMLRDFTKRQRKILDMIFRLSYGCNKKVAIIPHQRDFELVGVYESDVQEQLAWLETSKIIIRNGPEYAFNKDFDQWQISRVNPFQPGRPGRARSLWPGKGPHLLPARGLDAWFHGPEIPLLPMTG